jgi:mono/diheme cytochrome c family protein
MPKCIVKKMGWSLISTALLVPISLAAASDNAVQQGEYLVKHVAMCVQCHTPRDQRGELDQTQLLQGAPVPMGSPFASQAWAFKAPKLAGLPGGYSADDLVRLLQTGRTPRGNFPQPPMPPFRMTQEDAAAVAAYLLSLRNE